MRRLELIKNHLSLSLEVCIVAAGRSPIKPFMQDFSNMSDSDLSSQVIKGMLAVQDISELNIEEFYLGKVFTSNTGQALPKQILSNLSLGDHISCMSVNKLCASSMKAITMAVLSISSGNCECALAGGVEIMSQTPYSLNLRNGIPHIIKDTFNSDGFPDAVTKENPLTMADTFCSKHTYSKKTLDDYAEISCERAEKASKSGKFHSEIIKIHNKKNGKKIEKDTIKPKKIISNSKPVNKNGLNSAGNSCGINDGCAFILLCSRQKAVKEGWKVLGSIVGFADAEQDARNFLTTPALAVKKALKKAGLSMKDVDFMEINEPFAAVALENSKILQMDIEKINVYGGVIALGHPVGSSGCRIVGTLLNVLRQEGGKYGVAAICNAGGGGTALIVKSEE